MPAIGKGHASVEAEEFDYAKLVDDILAAKQAIDGMPVVKRESKAALGHDDLEFLSRFLKAFRDSDGAGQTEPEPYVLKDYEVPMLIPFYQRQANATIHYLNTTNPVAVYDNGGHAMAIWAMLVWMPLLLVGAIIKDIWDKWQPKRQAKRRAAHFKEVRERNAVSRASRANEEKNGNNGGGGDGEQQPQHGGFYEPPPMAQQQQQQHGGFYEPPPMAQQQQQQQQQYQHHHPALSSQQGALHNPVKSDASSKASSFDTSNTMINSPSTAIAASTTSPAIASTLSPNSSPPIPNTNSTSESNGDGLNNATTTTTTPILANPTAVSTDATSASTATKNNNNNNDSGSETGLGLQSWICQHPISGGVDTSSSLSEAGNDADDGRVGRTRTLTLATGTNYSGILGSNSDFGGPRL